MDKRTHLDPANKHSDSNKIIVLVLPESQNTEIRVWVRVLKQILKQLANLECSVKVEDDTNNSKDNDNDVQYIPEALEVGQPVLLDLDKLFNWIVEEEKYEQGFTRHDKMIHCRDVTNQFECTEAAEWDEATSCWKFPNQTEENECHQYINISYRHEQ